VGNEYIPPETRPLKALGGEEKSTRKEGKSVDRRGVERVLVLTYYTYCILPGTVLSYIKYCTVLYCTFYCIYIQNSLVQYTVLQINLNWKILMSIGLLQLETKGGKWDQIPSKVVGNLIK
jgi:hypothetical protein